ncbi:hypothetical protein EJ02DRAFT_147155 [Clathrospora elynae]|uniref:Uncharacterized protein n=1 Tax=Clathrospora elynae TaxID=706981 RepID=A0A6A5S3B6_9PLEO|nr:hypothetical protein EJ02DRAFT_147155 [Clathrospora elynae]
MSQLLVRGFENTIKNGDAHHYLHPVIDFYFRNPQCQVRLVFSSWYFEKPYNVVDLMRMGLIIKQAIHGMEGTTARSTTACVQSAHRRQSRQKHIAILPARRRRRRVLRRSPRIRNRGPAQSRQYAHCTTKLLRLRRRQARVFKQRFAKLAQRPSRKVELVLGECLMKMFFRIVERCHDVGVEAA